MSISDAHCDGEVLFDIHPAQCVVSFHVFDNWIYNKRRYVYQSEYNYINYVNTMIINTMNAE